MDRNELIMIRNILILFTFILISASCGRNQNNTPSLRLGAIPATTDNRSIEIPPSFDITNLGNSFEGANIVIKYYFDLGGSDIVFPLNCTIEFKGGSINNYGTITGNNTSIVANTAMCFDGSGTFAGTWKNGFNTEWIDIDNTGVTDASGSIQDALDFAENAAIKRISLDNGTYLINNSLSIPSGVEIIGNGAILKLGDNLSTSHILIGSSSNVLIKDLTILGNRSSFDTGSPENHPLFSAITASGGSGLRFENVILSELLGTGINVQNSKNVIISKCEFKDIGLGKGAANTYNYDAIYIGGEIDTTSNVIVKDCIFTNIGTFQGSHDGGVNDADGIQILTSTQSVTNVVISSCVFDSIDTRAIKLQAGDNVFIGNNICNNTNNFIGITPPKDIYNINISDNVASGGVFGISINGGNATYTERFYGFNVSGNTFSNCEVFISGDGNHYLEGAIISGNTFTSVSGGNASQVLGVRGEKILITNNNIEFESTAGYPFRIASNSKNVEFVRNTLRSRTDIFTWLRSYNTSATGIIIADNRLYSPTELYANSTLFFIDPSNDGSYTTIDGTSDVRNNLWNGRVRLRGGNYRLALPTTGVWIKGDIIYIKEANAGAIRGYQCTTGGDYSATPPVWKSIGDLAL